VAVLYLGLPAGNRSVIVIVKWKKRLKRMAEWNDVRDSGPLKFHFHFLCEEKLKLLD